MYVPTYPVPHMWVVPLPLPFLLHLLTNPLNLIAPLAFLCPKSTYLCHPSRILSLPLILLPFVTPSHSHNNTFPHSLSFLLPLTPSRSFEAEMFDRASKKLGLEQAVLGTRQFNDTDVRLRRSYRQLLFIFHATRSLRVIHLHFRFTLLVRISHATFVWNMQISLLLLFQAFYHLLTFLSSLPPS